ncbi:unnamed protein product [Closterium sp. NIES-54]
MANPMPSPSPLPPPFDTSSIDKLQLAADKSAINWHSFVGSICRVLNDAWVPPYCVLDVILRRPHALPPTEPDHPGETPPLPPSPGNPPLEPELQATADQATADADFILRRHAYLIRKAEYDAAADAYAQAVAGRNAHLVVVAKYTKIWLPSLQSSSPGQPLTTKLAPSFLVLSLTPSCAASRLGNSVPQ